MSTSRAVTWEGFFNTRDLGGLPTRSGGTTSYGAFFRAADLRFVTEAGWAQARESGVRTVIDLRNADEIRPPATPVEGVDRLEVPLDDIEDVELWQHIHRERLDGTPLYYPVFLRRKAERCAAVVKAMAHTDPGGVLFHCGIGRDRTGLVTLLLLALVDVEPQAIAADYALSAEAVRPLFAAMGVADQAPVVQAVLADRGTTVEEAVVAALEGFDVEQYLLGAGVTGGELRSVRSRLLGSRLR
ncbi:tyrosine-protein phosphatase [Amycolatopsis sp. NEAU-NG30]|uniref:Tyrosine-protein phosphatase n=1 Tax=Amycolatopsis melonis TaxID=3156488 RepID=A0ABV0LSM9_9PSEU